jgi:hypothetical protein
MGRRLLSLLKIVPELVSFYRNDRNIVSFQTTPRVLGGEEKSEKQQHPKLLTTQTNCVFPGRGTGPTGSEPNSYLSGRKSSLEAFIIQSHFSSRPV